MPPPIRVTLVPYDPRWAIIAAAEAERILIAAGPIIRHVHHIGSTAIPGIVAKPVIDLLGVVTNLAEMDTARSALERIGYAWHGEHGLARRRYCTLTDMETGQRRVQLHSFADGDPAITRHLAFRDYVRARPEIMAAYGQEKLRCAALHPTDSHAYSDCKGEWIARTETDALNGQ